MIAVISAIEAIRVPCSMTAVDALLITLVRNIALDTCHTGMGAQVN